MESESDAIPPPPVLDYGRPSQRIRWLGVYSGVFNVVLLGLAIWCLHRGFMLRLGWQLSLSLAIVGAATGLLSPRACAAINATLAIAAAVAFWIGAAMSFPAAYLMMAGASQSAVAACVADTYLLAAFGTLSFVSGLLAWALLRTKRKAG